MISAITRPGKVAWVSDMVKNESRRRTTCTPITPASAPAISASSRARCMSGESKVWSRLEDCAAATVDTVDMAEIIDTIGVAVMRGGRW